MCTAFVLVRANKAVVLPLMRSQKLTAMCLHARNGLSLLTAGYNDIQQPDEEIPPVQFSNETQYIDRVVRNHGTSVTKPGKYWSSTVVMNNI